MCSVQVYPGPLPLLNNFMIHLRQTAEGMKLSHNISLLPSVNNYLISAELSWKQFTRMKCQIMTQIHHTSCKKQTMLPVKLTLILCTSQLLNVVDNSCTRLGFSDMWT